MSATASGADAVDRQRFDAAVEPRVALHRRLVQLLGKVVGLEPARIAQHRGVLLAGLGMTATDQRHMPAPHFLKIGEVVTLDIAGLGNQRQVVRDNKR